MPQYTENPFDVASNPQAYLAWELVENTSSNLFLTGKAGTGKTTFLKRLRETSAKRIVVTAPTGIAAVNAGGVTLHSFFQLPISDNREAEAKTRRYDRFNKDKLRLIRTLDLLVIDEISMCRADLLDAVDASLRRHRDPSLPFGGVQLLLIGDLQQLSPVVRDSEAESLRQRYDTPYFFSSQALRGLPYNVIILERTYRQQNPEFLRLLNAIRDNNADALVLAALNARVNQGFNPDSREGYIRLVTHNDQARRINSSQLSALPGASGVYRAEVEGDFPQGGCNAEETLELKVGAQVMFLRNDSQNQVYNGMIGHVVAVGARKVVVQPVDSPRQIEVTPTEWKNIKYTTAPDSDKVTEEVCGTFRQLPLRLAWAITVHKSQGLTFSRAIIDVSHSFAHGQTYVALSRCTSLEGLVLERPLTATSLIYDNRVTAYTQACAAAALQVGQLPALRHRAFVETVEAVFSFDRLAGAFHSLQRAVEDAFGSMRPALTSQYAEAARTMDDKIAAVSRQFLTVMRGRLAQLGAGQGTALGDAGQQGVAGQQGAAAKVEKASDDPYLAERITSAARYFAEQLKPFGKLMGQTPATATNKRATTRLKEQRAAFGDLYAIATGVLGAIVDGLDLSKPAYHLVKSQTLRRLNIAEAPGLKATRSAKAAKGSKATKSTKTNKAIQLAGLGIDDGVAADVAADGDAATTIHNQELYDALSRWRIERAHELKVPAYCVASNRALIALSNADPLPDSVATLAALPNWGLKSAATHADSLLPLLDSLT